jgi:hypothetical protein
VSSHTLAVGQPYDPSRRSFPTTEQVRISRTLAELVRFWPNPTMDEVAAHDHGAAQFAVVDESPHLLVLGYQLGDLDWSDAPFQAHRMAAGPVGWPSGGPSEGLLFRTILMDSESGIVRSLRYDEWPAEFANVVRVGVAEQLVHDLDDATAGKRLDALYAQYSSPVELFQARAVAVCASEGPALGGSSGVTIHNY